MMKFIKMFFKPKLSREAFIAYFNKLPDTVEVSWMKDGGLIVGKVIAGDNEFMTQGRNADDFIEMVNDAVITAYRIPESYIEALKKTGKTYLPAKEVWINLNDGKITRSKFSFEKKAEVLRAV